MSKPRYAIITPCHNEADHLPQVIDAILAQSVLPEKWVILNDRSTDNTQAIIRQAADACRIILPVEVEGDRTRRVGANVVHLFNRGLAKLSAPLDFVVKMDGDVRLPPDYFQTIYNQFCQNPRLGMASGKTYVLEKNRWILERMPDTHVSGACKSYRWQCFIDIDGLIPLLGWDILDGAKSRLKGWQTMSFRELPIYHLRRTGSALGSVKGQIGHGRGMYAIRSHPLFVVARAIYRCLERPYGAGLFIIVGYVLSLARREERLADLKLARFVRQEQLGRLCGRTLKQEELLPRRFAGADHHHEEE